MTHTENLFKVGIRKDAGIVVEQRIENEMEG